jgi:DNA polymerase-1
MIGIHRRLIEEKPPASLLMQIHDELVFEVAPEGVDRLAQMVVEEMSQVLPLDVPLKIDVKFGDTWADCEPWQEA